ncbi:MAG: murein biosynthesis integral membrane protein MurJ [bacterium]|nr:murein biosynthesis integral membrane protein MurJ [bacterium]
MKKDEPAASGARFVALGILLSKVGGLLREMIIARFFGVGAHADVYRMAFRAPNVLQNMLGEQTLSAAFIPFYSRMLAEGREREAGRFAGAIFGLLVAVVSVLVVVGVLLAPAIVTVLVPGFQGDASKVAAGEMSIDRFVLTVRAVRIIFPMTGVLVLSAWALGVLNSHRRFLLPYLSPLVWNAAIVSALIFSAYGTGLIRKPTAASEGDLERWLFALCFGALVGGLLQFGVQLPLVFRLMKGFRVSLSPHVPGVRESLRALIPALAGRGVVQLSIYVDMFLASWLASGGPSALGFAVILINLPLGAFGISVAAAELPELASADSRGAEQGDAGRRIAERVARAARQSTFVIAPSVVGYLLFGFLVAGLVFRGGSFAHEDNVLVYLVLCAYTLGLLPSTLSRLLQNTFFALRDTRTPAKIAAVRLGASAALGALLLYILDHYSVNTAFGLENAGKELFLGAVGLGLAGSVGAWCELALLRHALRRPLPSFRLPAGPLAKRLALALTLAVPALILWALLPAWSVMAQALVVLPCYVACYLGHAWWRKAPELELWLGRRL